MKINKYNRPKANSTEGRAGTTSTIVSGGGATSEVSTQAKQLSETHLIFGQPFNGTQDVAGDITNVQNITTSGGDINVKATEDDEGLEGGNIYADVDIQAGNNVIGKKFIGDVDADKVTTNNLTAITGDVTNLTGSTIKYADADFKQAVIDALTSVDITTENLTVTKQAHFFELLIDKIRAAGGAILLTPADGFKVDKVKELEAGYRLLWKANDGDKAISNMWQIGDQAICQTFNNAQLGTNYNISNKYYWSLVIGVGTQAIEGEDYHYIDISDKDDTERDGNVNPEIGDEIAMLGYRGTDDASRQSAIYIAAYNSLDPTLKAPLICHYRGINDFNLKSHKYTWFAANGNEIRGNLRVESGQTLQDYIDNNVPSSGQSAYLHTAYANSADGSVDFSKTNITGNYLYIGLCSNFKADDADLEYTDYEWSRLKGDSITILSTVIEYAGSTSATVPPTTGWSTTVPILNNNQQYLWTRTTVRYSDGTKSISYSVSRFGKDGQQGNDAVRYYLQANSSNFHISSDGNITPDNTLVTAYKQEGSNNPSQFTAGRVYCSAVYQDGSEDKCAEGTGSVNIHSSDIDQFGCKVFRCYLYSGGTVVDTMDIPVITDGTDADYYKLVPVTERAEVNSNGDLDVNFSYQIAHIVGTSSSIITATSNNFYVRFKDNTKSTYTSFSYGTTPSYIQSQYLQQYGDNRGDDTEYFTIELVKGGLVYDRRIIPVIYKALAVIEITDSILSRVTNNYTTLNGKITTNTNNISTLKQTAESLQSTVRSQTTQINNINGTVSGHSTKISQLEQTAEGLTSTVSKLDSTNLIHTNYFNNSDEQAGQSVVYNSNTDTYTMQMINSEIILKDESVQVGDIDYSSKKWIKLQAGKYLVSFIPTVADDVRMKVDIWLREGAGVGLYTTKNVITYKQKSTEYSGKLQTYVFDVTDERPWFNIYFESAFNADGQEQETLPWTIKVQNLSLAPYTAITSLIQQTADNITLQVQDVALRIDNKKIVLDGDTEVNGSLTLDNSDQGFVLKGESGTTYIQPQSIGTYSQFSSKSTNKVSAYFKIDSWLYDNTSQIDNSSQYKEYSGQQTNTYTLGAINSGAYLQFTDQTYTLTANDGGFVNKGIVRYQLYCDDQLIKTTNISTANTSSVFTYTTTKAGTYKVVTTASYSATRNKTGGNNTQEPVSNGIRISGYLRYYITLPTTAFMLIGYDGLAVNFGNNKTAYIGKNETTIRYGNNALKVSEAGLQKLDPNGSGNWCALDTKKIKILTADYTLESDVDFIVLAASGTNRTVTFPSTAVTGRTVYVKDRGNNASINIANANSRLMASGAYQATNNIQVNNIACFFVFDGTYWIQFYCG